MRWGFKKWAEDQAIGQRRAMKLRAEAPLPARRLADHLHITVIGPEQVPGMTPALLHQLLQEGRASWSALTLSVGERHLIIHNTEHSLARQESDIMHDIAHLLCDHRPMQLVQPAGLPFPLREYDADQEEEATWLGGCLQLPRAALWWAVQQGMSNVLITQQFGASAALVRYRRNITGVDRQLERMRKPRYG